MAETTIGFIGGGQMASALARGFVGANLVQAEDLRVADVSPPAIEAFLRQLPGAKVCAVNDEVVRESDVIFLAVKPQNIGQVAAGVSNSFAEDKLLVSICAGVTLQTLRARFRARRLIRVMPNTPCLIGAGASAFCMGGEASERDAELVNRLLECVGVVVRLDEQQLDAVTGLSGSGPAFIYQVIEALGDAGVHMGLPRDVAHRLATQTVLGAARMVEETGEHPAVLKDRVASPGGTTIAGIRTLEAGGLRAAIMDAVAAATERSVELGRQG